MNVLTRGNQNTHFIKYFSNLDNEDNSETSKKKCVYYQCDSSLNEWYAAVL